MLSTTIYWRSDREFINLCFTNHLVITPLEERHLEALIALLQRNANEDGFLQMDPDITSGHDICNLLKNNNSFLSNFGRCLIALDARSGVLLGFIIVKRDEDDNCVISELGVDAQYSSKHRQAGDPQNIGKVLLLTGCNEILTTIKEPRKIGVLASNNLSVAYYKKFHFKQMNPDENDELELHIEDYPKLVQDVILSMQKASELSGVKTGFFNFTRTKMQGEAEKKSLVEIVRRSSPGDSRK